MAKQEKSTEETRNDVRTNGNRPSRKGNGKKGGRRPKYQNKRGAGYPDAAGSNDLSWHVQSEQLLKESSEMSYSYATGNPMEYTMLANNSSGSIVSKTYTMPGLAVIYDALSLGGADENSVLPPMTYAANSLMQEMRSKIRPNQSYDAPDVAMKMSGMAEIYGAIAFCKRLIATTNMYATMNSYLPDMLFKAQKVDPTYLKEFRASFVSKLNQIILDVNKIYIPNRMTLFPYIMEKYANYYSEGPSIKDQIYFWSPSMFKAYVWTATTDYAAALIPCITFPYDSNHAGKVPGYLHCKYGNDMVPTDVLINTLEYMVRCMLQDSDTPIICGDLENAFGSENRFVIPLAQEDSLAMPTVNPEMLEMFMNSRVCTAVSSWFHNYDYQNQIGLAAPWRKQGWVYQNPTTNTIQSDLTFITSDLDANISIGDSRDVFINTHEIPNSAKTMLLSRYANYVSRVFFKDTSLTPPRPNNLVTVSTASSLVCYIAFYKMVDIDTMEEIPWQSTNSVMDLRYLSVTDPFHYRPDTMLIDTSIGDPIYIYVRADIVGLLKHEQQTNMNRIDLMTMCGAYNRF